MTRSPQAREARLGCYSCDKQCDGRDTWEVCEEAERRQRDVSGRSAVLGSESHLLQKSHQGDGVGATEGCVCTESGSTAF